MKVQSTQNMKKPMELPPKPGGDVTIEKKKKASALSVLFFYAVIGSIVVIFNWAKLWPWIQNHLVPIIILGTALAASVVGVVVFKGVRAIWHGATGKVGVIIFLGIPLIAALVGAVLTMPDNYRVSTLRAVFLMIVIFLPALLYYLFVALRRISLLQEFFTNLAKLGLFERRSAGNGESEEDRKTRVMTYLQKFESIYGAIPDPLAEQIVQQTDPDLSSKNKRVPDFHLYQAGLITPEAIPVVVTTLLIGLGWLLVLPPWDTSNSDLSTVLKPTPDAVLFAFLGAYFYALQMLFRRFVRRDLRANAYVSISQRIILAVIGVWAVLQVAQMPGVFFSGDGSKFQTAGSLLVTGFVVGAFPPIAWQIVQAAFRKITRAKHLVPSLDSPMPLRELDGLTVWHEGRLEEEDIENVQNMATANIVELMLNTRYPPDRIVDWVDQAMLYTQLGKQRKNGSKAGASNPIDQLKKYGIRTASSLIAAYQMNKMRKDPIDFKSILSENGQSRIPSIVDALSTNPNLGLIQRWNGTIGLAGISRVIPVAYGSRKPLDSQDTSKEQSHDSASLITPA